MQTTPTPTKSELRILNGHSQVDSGLRLTMPGEEGNQGVNIYQESEDGFKPPEFGAQYAIPVSAGAQSSTLSFDMHSPSSDCRHEYHQLEPHTEVLETGHHYHLLDVSNAVSLL